MKNRFFNLVVVVAVLQLTLYSAAFAKAKKADNSAKVEASASAAEQSGAKIKFDAVSHDFGKVAPGSANNCKFGFSNVGTGTLKIDRLQGTCKCTVPDLKKKEYAPGESGEITVQFHAPKYQGPTSQHVMVFSNDANTSRAELEIKAYVESQVQVTPDQMSLSLLAPNAGASEITIKSIDKEKFAITKVESPGNVVSIDFDPNNSSDTHVFKPVINIDNLHKYLDGYIVFTLNHPRCTSVRVQYSCMKEFETSPSVIILRNAVAGEVQARTIYVTSNYNQPIEIESITSDKGIVKVTGQEKTENRFKLDVTVTPPAREGRLRVFSDNLHIKIKGKEQIDIPCRGFYKAQL